MEFVDHLITVSVTDLEDARRRRILNILLIGTCIAAFLGLLYTVIIDITRLDPAIVLGPVYFGVIMVIIGTAILFIVNRYWSGRVASIFFVLLLILSLAFGDEPKQVVEGRTLFMFAVPILISSVILRPYYSFVVAVIIGVILNIIAFGDPQLVTPHYHYAPGIINCCSSGLVGCKEFRTSAA